MGLEESTVSVIPRTVGLVTGATGSQLARFGLRTFKGEAWLFRTSRSTRI